MGIFQNGAYNNPSTGQAFENIASMFSPPTLQEQVLGQSIAANNANAAKRAAALAGQSPHIQKLAALYQTPSDMAQGAQLELADSGASPAAQDAWAYAKGGVAGNTFAGKQIDALSKDQVRILPAGVASTLGVPAMQTNESKDPTEKMPSVDQVTAGTLANLIKSPNDPAAQAAYATALKAKSGGTTVSIDQRAPGAIEEGYGKAVGEDIGDVVKAGGSAPQIRAQTAQMRRALDSAGANLTTGPLAQIILKGKQGLGGLLGTTLDGVPEAEVINNVGNTLATQGARAISNRPTQFEFAQQLAVKPGLAQSPQGMRALLDIKDQEAADNENLAVLASKPENRANWQAVKARYYAEHPVMSPFDKTKAFGQGDIDALAGAIVPPDPKPAPAAAAPAAPAAPAPVTPFSANMPPAAAAPGAPIQLGGSTVINGVTVRRLK